MTAERVPPQVLEDLEEIFDAEGMLPLYQVAWTLSGSMSRDDDHFIERCRDVYEAFGDRHPGLRLMWTQWPIDLAEAKLAEPGTAIDLDLDPDAPVDTPLLVLVPPGGPPD